MVPCKSAHPFLRLGAPFGVVFSREAKRTPAILRAAILVEPYRTERKKGGVQLSDAKVGVDQRSFSWDDHCRKPTKLICFSH